MKEKTIIKLDNLSMCFNLNSEKIYSLKEYFIKFLKKDLNFEKIWALKNISFELKEGDILGIVGYNGAGKSTLLKVISGIIRQTEGEIKDNGRISPLIE